MSATTDLAMGKKDSRDDSESCLCSRMTKLATLPAFTLCLGAYGLTYGMLLTYYVSQVTSLEKIFGFSSEDIGWVISFYEIGHIAAVIFVGYFGHTAHRPRLLAAGAFLIGTCSILMALPNFLYTGIAVVHSNASASESFTFQRYCDQTSRNGSVGVCPEGQTTHHQKLNTGAYTIIAVAFSVAGIGPTTLWTVGISYIDDNADPKRSSFFVSIMFSLRTLAPVVGYFFGSLASSFYIDLSADTGLKPDDPDWLGAWWLGFFIIGCLTILTSLPLMTFPKRLPRNNPANDTIETPENIPEEKSLRLKETLNDLKNAVWRLCKNPVFVLINLKVMFEVAAGHGFSSYLPKYIEVQFQQPTYMANLLTGVALALTTAIGVGLSGFVTSRLQWPLKKKAFWAWIISTIGILMSLLLFSFGCPTRSIEGFQKTTNKNVNVSAMTSNCNSDCQCSNRFFHPVCGEGKTFFSPCLAGCNIDSEGIYYSCSCVSGNSVTRNPCDSHCEMLAPYLVVLFCFILTTSIATMPWVMYSIRCVEPRDKSLAMGLISFTMSVFLFPVPALYGASIDGTCLLERPSLKCDSDQSRCLLYDNDRFRFRLHLLSFGIEILSPICTLAAWYTGRNRPLYGEGDDNNDGDKRSVDIAINSCSVLNVNDYNREIEDYSSTRLPLRETYI